MLVSGLEGNVWGETHDCPQISAPSDLRLDGDFTYKSHRVMKQNMAGLTQMNTYLQRRWHTLLLTTTLVQLSL